MGNHLRRVPNALHFPALSSRGMPMRTGLALIVAVVLAARVGAQFDQFTWTL